MKVEDESGRSSRIDRNSAYLRELIAAIAECGKQMRERKDNENARNGIQLIKLFMLLFKRFDTSGINLKDYLNQTFYYQLGEKYNNTDPAMAHIANQFKGYHLGDVNPCTDGDSKLDYLRELYHSIKLYMNQGSAPFSDIIDFIFEKFPVIIPVGEKNSI